MSKRQKVTFVPSREPAASNKCKNGESSASVVYQLDTRNTYAPVYDPHVDAAKKVYKDEARFCETCVPVLKKLVGLGMIQQEKTGDSLMALAHKLKIETLQYEKSHTGRCFSRDDILRKPGASFVKFIIAILQNPGVKALFQQHFKINDSKCDDVVSLLQGYDESEYNCTTQVPCYDVPLPNIDALQPTLPLTPSGPLPNSFVAPPPTSLSPPLTLPLSSTEIPPLFSREELMCDLYNPISSFMSTQPQDPATFTPPTPSTFTSTTTTTFTLPTIPTFTLSTMPPSLKAKVLLNVFVDNYEDLHKVAYASCRQPFNLRYFSRGHPMPIFDPESLTQYWNRGGKEVVHIICPPEGPPNEMPLSDAEIEGADGRGGSTNGSGTSGTGNGMSGSGTSGSGCTGGNEGMSGSGTSGSGGTTRRECDCEERHTDNVQDVVHEVISGIDTLSRAFYQVICSPCKIEDRSSSLESERSNTNRLNNEKVRSKLFLEEKDYSDQDREMSTCNIMEICCQEFQNITIATNHQFPRGISGSPFMKGRGVLVKCKTVSEELYKRMFISNTHDLKYLLKLKTVPLVSWATKNVEVPFSLLADQANPHPVKLVRTEEGVGLSSVEFFIDKIASCFRVGLTSYKNYSFHWSVELWNGEDLVYSVDSPIIFYIRAVSKIRKKVTPLPKRRRGSACINSVAEKKEEPEPVLSKIQPALPDIPLGDFLDTRNIKL